MSEVWNEAEDLRRRLREARYNDRVLQDKLDEADRMIDWLGAMAQGFKAQWQASDRAREASEARCVALEEALEDSSRSVAPLRAEATAAKQALEEARGRLAVKEGLIRKLRTERSDAVDRADEAEKRIERLTRAASDTLHRATGGEALDWLAQWVPEMFSAAWWDPASSDWRERRQAAMGFARQGWVDGGSAGMAHELRQRGFKRSASAIESKLTDA